MRFKLSEGCLQSSPQVSSSRAVIRGKNVFQVKLGVCFLIIIVEIIFGVKKIKMFILVDPSRGLVRVYCLYVCMFVFCFALLYIGCTICTGWGPVG